MANRVTFYCESDAVHELVEHHGSHLQQLGLREKLMLRAALSTYQLWCHQAESYGRKPEPKRTIQDAIEAVDSDAWEALEPLIDWLIDFIMVEESDDRQDNFEGFIKGLTDAISCHSSDD
ncbi:MAG TPA: hypothetical protein V6C95_09730 [Coleofasciculaceae cyanobacterium]